MGGYMRKISSFLVLCLVLSSSGCSVFGPKEDPTEAEYRSKKASLERKITLLRLERRELLLQNSIDRLDSQPLPGDEDKEPE